MFLGGFVSLKVTAGRMLDTVLCFSGLSLENSRQRGFLPRKRFGEDPCGFDRFTAVFSELFGTGAALYLLHIFVGQKIHFTNE